MSTMKGLCFALVYRLLLSDRVRDYQEKALTQETAVEARRGPLELGLNDCHVLDSRDAWVQLRLGRLRLTGSVCLGSEPIRASGLSIRRYQGPS